MNTTDITTAATLITEHIAFMDSAIALYTNAVNALTPALYAGDTATYEAAKKVIDQLKPMFDVAGVK